MDMSNGQQVLRFTEERSYLTDLQDTERILHLPNFRGIFMRNTLPAKSLDEECGIVNLEPDTESGSHWVAYSIKKGKCFYYDSYGGPIPINLNKYMKTKEEYEKNLHVIAKSEIITQLKRFECGQLCLYVLYSVLVSKNNFPSVLLMLQKRLVENTPLIIYVQDENVKSWVERGTAMET